MSSASLRQGTSLELKDIEEAVEGVRYSRLSEVKVESLESSGSLSSILGYDVESLSYRDKGLQSTEFKHFAPFAIRDFISSHPLVTAVMFDDFGGPEKRREKEEEWAAHEAKCCYSPTTSIVLRVVSLLGFALFLSGAVGLLVMFILSISSYESSVARSRFYVVGGIVFPSLLVMGVVDFYVVIIWRLLRMAYAPASIVVVLAVSFFGLMFYGITIPVVFVLAIVVECLDTQARIDAEKEETIRKLGIPDTVIALFRPFSTTGPEIVLDESEVLVRTPTRFYNELQEQYEMRVAASVQPLFDLLREILRADMQDRSSCFLDFGKSLALFECLKTATKLSALKVRWAATPDVGVFLRSLNLEFEETVLAGEIILPHRFADGMEDLPMGRLVDSLENVATVAEDGLENSSEEVVSISEGVRINQLFHHVERLSESFETISRSLEAQTMRFDMLEKKIESEFQSMKDMLMKGL